MVIGTVVLTTFVDLRPKIAVEPIACILLYAIYLFAPYLPQQNGVGEWRNQTRWTPREPY